jgi:hypothetical protein
MDERRRKRKRKIERKMENWRKRKSGQLTIRIVTFKIVSANFRELI